MNSILFSGIHKYNLISSLFTEKLIRNTITMYIKIRPAKDTILK